MRFGEIEIKGGGIPVMKVTLNERDEDERSRKGYLSPFRGYKFQVSGTQDGSGDNGSSHVIGLGLLVLATEGYNPSDRIKSSRRSTFASNYNYQNGNVAKEILKTFAKEALGNFAGNGEEHRLYYEEEVKLTEFINACYAWIKEEIKKEEDA